MLTTTDVGNVTQGQGLRIIKCYFEGEELGINAQVAMSALGSGCACPAAFTAHCPRLPFQRVQVPLIVRALPLPEWFGLRTSGLYRVGRTSGGGEGGGGGAQMYVPTKSKSAVQTPSLGLAYHGR